MSDKAAKPGGRLAGVTSFGGDDGDYIAPPPREVRDKAKQDGEQLGFISDKPEAVAISRPLQPTASRGRSRAVG